MTARESKILIKMFGKSQFLAVKDEAIQRDVFPEGKVQTMISRTDQVFLDSLLNSF